ncbi:MAG TPA: LLM class flavin-dependent oxidoreductase, partial [Ilumatobacteraceae bacterium]|nr:LLM class flavin-dependent oxidoreductase [Ilumatobacteraceae bacterium]
MSEPNWSEDAPTQFWTSGMPIPRIAEQQAVTAEELGWDGIVFPDSQNLAADCYSILTLAATATDRLGLGVGVTNTFTRHPAVTASAIATVQAISRGRAVLGIGRGDSALAQIGLAPVGLSSFERDVAAIQTYLRGEPVSFDRSAARADGVHGVDQLEVATRPQESRIEWIRPTDGKVPVEIAASGPRVLGIAARHADIVSLNVGADPARVAWAV